MTCTIVSCNVKPDKISNAPTTKFSERRSDTGRLTRTRNISRKRDATLRVYRSARRLNKRIIHLYVYEARAIIDDKYWQMLDRVATRERPLSLHPKHLGLSFIAPLGGAQGARQRAPQNREQRYRGFFRGIVGSRHRLSRIESQCINQAVSVRNRPTMFDSARGIADDPQRRVKILNCGAEARPQYGLDDKWYPVAHSTDLEKPICHS